MKTILSTLLVALLLGMGVSAQAGMITGVAINVDGGRTRGIP